VNFPDEVDTGDLEIMKKEWELTDSYQTVYEKNQQEWVNNSTTASNYSIYAPTTATTPWQLTGSITNGTSSYYPIDYTMWSILSYPVYMEFRRSMRTVAVYERRGRGHPWKKTYRR
jgi:hypothetical protein